MLIPTDTTNWKTNSSFSGIVFVPVMEGLDFLSASLPPIAAADLGRPLQEVPVLPSNHIMKTLDFAPVSPARPGNLNL